MNVLAAQARRRSHASIVDFHPHNKNFGKLIDDPFALHLIEVKGSRARCHMRMLSAYGFLLAEPDVYEGIVDARTGSSDAAGRSPP